MDKLVIVESPTKARTLTRFLGSGFRIEATMGHVRDLPPHSLGIKIFTENNNTVFTPEYQIITDRKKRVAELKKLAQSADNIILATDPDREGEAIAYHIREILPKDNHRYSRIVFHEITKSAINDALAHPKDVDMELVNAQLARRVLDRLVGYKLSPLLWNKLGKRWLSAGRVQSVAVRLIVEREREIEAFKPVEYWTVEVDLEKNSEENNRFKAKLQEINGKKAEITNKVTADAAVSDLQKSRYQVTAVDKREVRRNPAPPYTTSTLQQAASNKYGWSAKRTIKTAQTLYEEGFITYHRTDSTNLSQEAISMVRAFIPQMFGDAYLPAEAKLYKTKSKVAQEAHEAIRPTNTSVVSSYDLRKLIGDGNNNPNLTHLDEKLGRDAELLYSLIWKRFIACQMKEAVFDQTGISIRADQPHTVGSNVYMLRANGQLMKFAGWLAVFGANQKKSSLDEPAEDNGQEDTDNILPELTVDEILRFINVSAQQKFTEPPPRYTEASLIKALEEKGIGRPSTYAPIISTIQDRKYVEKIEKKFKPSDLGVAVTDFLVQYFPDIFDVGFTASMESELDEIANGKREWDKVTAAFYSPFITKLDQVFKQAGRVKLDLGTTDELCPECGNPLAIRMSKYGKFLACSTYPNCKYTKNIIEKVGIPCPRCGGDIIVRKTRKGKQFYGCSNYPKCNFAAWKKEQITKEAVNTNETKPASPSEGQIADTK